jgi:hypothetical protein
MVKPNSDMEPMELVGGISGLLRLKWYEMITHQRHGSLRRDSPHQDGLVVERDDTKFCMTVWYSQKSRVFTVFIGTYHHLYHHFQFFSVVSCGKPQFQKNFPPIGKAIETDGRPGGVPKVPGGTVWSATRSASATWSVRESLGEENEGRAWWLVGFF